jgi:CheY-like chemotaxis protein
MNPETTHTHCTSPSSGKGCILLVDDEGAVLTVGQAILSTTSFQVITARSGEEAVETFRVLNAEGRKPACVILDLTMPGGLSGFETLQELRSMDENIPVIACSGYFEDNAHDLCCALGFSEALEKPYTPDSLTSIVRRFGTRHSSGDDSAHSYHPAKAGSEHLRGAIA